MKAKDETDDRKDRERERDRDAHKPQRWPVRGRTNHYAPFFALYAQSRSCAQSRQRVAAPALGGFLSLRKCWREPKDETRIGLPGESQWQRMSTSLVTLLCGRQSG